MCIFTSKVSHVSNTRIFARRTRDALQHLVYSMSLKSLGETAMVLPLPIADAATEIEFIDLSSHPQFFDDLRRAILKENLVHIIYGTQSQIPVQTVGAYHASFVPNRNEFSRLDQQFQLSSSILETLPYDCTWGFAVFQLRESLDTQAFHPFGLTFHGRSDFPLYFPTMHVHDGKVDETARYDHELFMQADRPADPTSFPEDLVDDIQKDKGLIDAEPVKRDGRNVRRRTPPVSFSSTLIQDDWRRSNETAGKFVQQEPGKWVVDPDARIYRKTMNGRFPNGDLLVPQEVLMEMEMV